MPYYYALCDVFVLPSQGGVVLNEAMACGKPVIASISDGREADLIIDGENGFIIKEGDIVSLSKYIKIILFNGDLARRMGIKSRQIIDQEFTLQKMAEGFKKALDYAFKSKP